MMTYKDDGQYIQNMKEITSTTHHLSMWDKIIKS